MHQKGFTLIEMMMVIVILGILSATSMPNFHPLRDQARMIEAKTFANMYKKDVLEYYQYTGQFPLNNQAAGIAPANAIQGQYVQSVYIDHGEIHVHMKQKKLYEKEKHKTFMLRPVIRKGHVTSPVLWLQSNEAIPEGYLLPRQKNDTIQIKGVSNG